MTSSLIHRIWYFAPAHKGFPSAVAPQVQVMKACDAFVLAGAPTTLVVPHRPETPRLLKAAGKDLWEFFAVTRELDIRWCRFAYPWTWAQQGLYGLNIAAYALRHGVRLAYTRSEWMALSLWASGMHVILELHDLIPNHALNFMLRQARAGRLLGIVCNSQAMANAVVDLGCPEPLALAAPNGVDLEHFEPRLDKAEARSLLGFSLDVPLACYAGNLHRDRPAIETLLDCAVQLPQVSFVFVGGRPEDVALCRRLADHRRLTNCRFVGSVPHGRLLPYLYAADVLLISYTHHTVSHRIMSPMKMFEYLATGRPIIASEFPVLREVLVDGTNALLVSPGSPLAFASALRRALDDPVLSQRLSEEAVITAKQHTWLGRQRRILEFMGVRLEATVRPSTAVTKR